MLNFKNKENLVAYMFETTDNEFNLVSVVSCRETAVEIMKELLKYENVILNNCEIDSGCEYDKEYLVSLYDDTESEYWYISIEKEFNTRTEKYLGAGGYVLFHENANSKAMVDMLNNEFMPLGEHDWFVTGSGDGSEAENFAPAPADDITD